MTDSLVDLAARCAVAIYGGGRFLGSGFLAAPGQVLSCAHVVAESGASSLMVRWLGREFAARRAQLIPPQAAAGRRTYDPPDLALITVDAQPEQPFVWLADHGPAVGSELLCLGFSEVTTEAGVAADSVRLQVAAASGGGFIRVQHGEIPRGMSGSLALDLGTHRVCGLVKTSRDTEAPRGGWIIPVSAIAGQLGTLVEQNSAGHGPMSPWRQLATRHAEFARRLFGSRSPLRVTAPQLNPPPSWWLDPRHRATAFQERPELESLLAWASDEDPATPVATLVVGEGGSGKTRLALELATRLAACGWIAGMLTIDDLGRMPTVAESLHEILAYGHRVFIALDYAEGMGDELTRFLAQLPLPDEGIVRILLLARFGGGWWDALHPAGDIKYLIDSKPLELTPLCPDPNVAARRFGEALRDYRLRIRGPADTDVDTSSGVAMPPTLADAARRHDSAIRLHALALVSALHERDHGALPDGEVAWADPLDSLVNHERKHWAEAARGRALSCARDAGWAGRILLVPTLLAVYRGEEASAAIARIPGLVERFPGEAPEAAALLRDLYPPDESASLRWWSSLPLDRLGETLLAKVLKDLKESVGDYVAALLRPVSLPEAIDGLTLLTRLGTNPEAPDDARAALGRCLDMLAAADGSRMLPALLVADRQIPLGVQRPGESRLARLGAIAAMALVQELIEKCDHRLLQETGLALLDHAERVLDIDTTRFRGPPGSAREIVAKLRDSGIDIPAQGLLHIYAKALRAELLLHLRRAGEAIAPAEAAAQAMRAVHQASGGQGVLFDGSLLVTGSDKSDYSKPLLQVLDVYAEALRIVGRLAESSEVRRECAAAARHEADQGDLYADRALVSSLCKLAQALLELDQAAQGEPWAREAVERSRSLADLAPQAGALAIWARTLRQVGRLSDARSAAADAVRMFRQVANVTGDHVLAAQAIERLGDLAPPETVGFDPLPELRATASRDPASGVPAFVFAATRRAEDLARHGDLTGARQQVSEALAEARRLAADDPHTHAHVVAYVLVRGAQVGCSADPIAEVAEAAGIYRRLVDDHHRDDMRADLALALMQHSLLLRDAGRDTDALPGFAQAIGMLRPLLVEDRWRNTPYLCTALNLFAETAAKHGDPEQAVAAAREAIDLEISRTDDVSPTPAEHLPQIRRTLFLALLPLVGVRMKQEADTAVITALLAEANRVARDVPAGTLDAHDFGVFAGALWMLGDIQSRSEHPEDALPPFDEAIEILHNLAGSSPAPDPSLLLRIGASRVYVYRVLDRHAEAARATAEALADCRLTRAGWERERADCVRMAADVLVWLGRLAHTALVLPLAADLSRTCREWRPRGGMGEQLLTAVVVSFSDCLIKAVGAGVSPDEWRAAALEVSAGIQLLAEQQPSLLRAEHVRALAQAATALAAARRPDEALDVNTRAVELYQSLDSVDDDLDPLPILGSLVQQGVFLAEKQRHEDAIRPLEQALPILLAAGPNISAAQAILLRSTVDLLRQAYHALKRDYAIQSMIDAFQASGIPPVMNIDWTSGETGGELRATLQAAEKDAATEPDRVIAVFGKLLGRPAGSKEYLDARVACGKVVVDLSKAGRFPEALRLCDLLATSGGSIGLGEWPRLDGTCRRLNVQLDAGFDAQAVLAEATELTARVDEHTAESGLQDDADLGWVRETLLRVSGRAALRLRRWPDAIRFVQAEAHFMRARGAPIPEVAVAEFNAYSALVSMGRIPEATELLDRCEAAFSDDHEERDKRDLHLGLVTQARAEMAANTGDLLRGVRLQSEALAALYRSRDVRQIQRGHAAFSVRHTQADPYSALALAHALAAAILAELLGQTPDIQTITTTMTFRAGEYPATAAALTAALSDTPGEYFSELAEHLCRPRTAGSMNELLAKLLRQARQSQRDHFDEWARYRMLWDPVFAGIFAARQGQLADARAVTAMLAAYAEDESWSKLCEAVGHVFRQCPEAVAAVPLDGIDKILLRRCTDVLSGVVHIPPELIYAIPIGGLLVDVLFAAQKGQTSPVLARTLETLTGEGYWRPLVSSIQKILAGDRGSQVTSGLDHPSTVIITTLLAHLVSP